MRTISFPRGFVSTAAMIPVRALQRLVAACFLLTIPMTGCSCLDRQHNDVAAEVPVHYVRQGNLDLTWREEKTPEGLRLYGILRNYHTHFLQNLCMTVTLVDDRGKVVASQSYNDFPMIFRPKAAQPFLLVFPSSPRREKEDAFFDFIYSFPNPLGPDFNVYQGISCVTPQPPF